MQDKDDGGTGRVVICVVQGDEAALKAAAGARVGPTQPKVYAVVCCWFCYTDLSHRVLGSELCCSALCVALAAGSTAYVLWALWM